MTDPIIEALQSREAARQEAIESLSAVHEKARSLVSEIETLLSKLDQDAKPKQKRRGVTKEDVMRIREDNPSSGLAELTEKVEVFAEEKGRDKRGLKATVRNVLKDSMNLKGPASGVGESGARTAPSTEAAAPGRE